MDSTTNATTKQGETTKLERCLSVPQSNIADESKVLAMLSRGFPGETFVFNKRVVVGSLRYNLDVFMPDYNLVIDIININDVKCDQRDTELIKLLPNINILRVPTNVVSEILTGLVFRHVCAGWRSKANAEREELEEEIARLKTKAVAEKEKLEEEIAGLQTMIRLGVIRKDISELEATKARFASIRIASAETS